MFDPFDAFDPIDPVPAPEPEVLDEAVRSETAPSAPPLVDDGGERHAGTPTDDPRSIRRWTTTASRRIQPRQPVRDPAPAPPTDSPADHEDVLPADPGGVPASGSPDIWDWSLDAAPKDPGPSAHLADLAVFRAATLSELRAAARRLSAHGHDASVTDLVDSDEPRVTIQFLPDGGPLAPSHGSFVEPACLEVRLAIGRDGEPQVSAGYTRGHETAPVTLLGQTPIQGIDRDWVARRFVEFVQRVLGLE